MGESGACRAAMQQRRCTHEEGRKYRRVVYISEGTRARPVACRRGDKKTGSRFMSTPMLQLLLGLVGAACFDRRHGLLSDISALPVEFPNCTGFKALHRFHAQSSCSLLMCFKSFSGDVLDANESHHQSSDTHYRQFKEERLENI